VHSGIADVAASPAHDRGARICGLRRVLATVMVTAVGILAFPALSLGASLNVVPNGPEGVSVTVTAAGTTNPPCAAIAIKATACSYTYPQGEMVTLSASINQFVGWSDVRCPPTPTCTISLDEQATTVTASYAVQRVWVRISGTGTVAPAGGAPCAVAPGDPTTADCGLFALGSRVTLTGTPASAIPPTWQRALSNPARPLCDDPPGVDATSAPTCAIDVNGLRWGNVAFDGQPLSSAVPSSVSVNFHIIKVGTGAGSVRSGSLDCGGRCTTERTFGNRETLVAAPGSGSRFVRWRGACGTAPTCALAVGPVTAISAEFQATRGSRTATGGRALVARIVGAAVRGRGRRRTVRVTVQVNAAANVRVALLKGRRTFASRRRSVPGGRALVALRVPARAAAGSYRVRMTVRDRAGRTTTTARRVRLGR
jgi:Divergent InlB B-repeat domain